jgi:ABC-type transporter Mla subunit MlaD
MANAVTATFGADTSQFNASLVSMETATEAFRKKFRSNLTASFAQLAVTGTTPLGSAKDLEKAAHSTGSLTMAMREFLVVGREIGRGNWSRVPGSLSLAMQNLGLSLTSVIIPLAAVGLAAFAVFKHFQMVRDAARKLEDIFHPLVKNLEAEQDSLRKSSEAMAEYRKKMDELAQGHRGESQSIHEKINALKQELSLRRQLAGKLGASPAQIEEMNIADLEKEKAFTDKQVKILEQKVNLQKKLSDSTAKTLNSTNKISNLEDVSERRKESLSLVKKIQEQLMKDENYRDLLRQQKAGILNPTIRDLISTVGNGIMAPGGVVAPPREVLLTLSDFTNKIIPEFGISLTEATKLSNELNKKQTALQGSSANLKEASSRQVNKYGELTTTLTDLKNKSKSLADEIKNQKEYGMALAVASSASTGGYALNAQQKIGAYAATPPDMKIQTDLLRQVAINTAGLRRSPNEPPNATPPRFSSLFKK